MFYWYIWPNLCVSGQIRGAGPNRGPRPPRVTRRTWRARFTWICWEGRWKGGSAHTVYTDHHHHPHHKESSFVSWWYILFFFSPQGDPGLPGTSGKNGPAGLKGFRGSRGAPGVMVTPQSIQMTWLLNIFNNIRYIVQVMCDLCRDLLVWKVDQDLMEPQEP